MFCQRILSIWTCFVICWLTINSRLTFQSSVPLLVWSNTPSSSSSGVIDKQSFNTLVDSIDTKDLIEDYSKLKTPIAVFVQKDLSLEQFSSNEAPFVASLFTQSHLNPTFFANVNKPEQIYSNFKGHDQASLKDNVVIHLPGSSLKENDEMIHSLVEKYNLTGQAMTLMLTGENNEYLNEKKRFRRAIENDKPFFGTYPNEKEACVLVSVSKATLTLDTKSDKQEKFFYGQPSISSGECVKSAGKIRRAEKVKLSFKSNEGNLYVTFGFMSESNGSYWNIKSLELSLEPKHGSFESKLPDSWTLNDLSFSCSNLTVKLVNGSSQDYPSGKVSFDLFQIQPFFNSEDKEVKFKENSNCAVWFTIPMWSGLIVILILIAILYSGIMALMSIITPDRFENPKGRQLIITNVEE